MELRIAPKNLDKKNWIWNETKQPVLDKKNQIWNIEYSILNQKSKGSGAFDEQKVKNIAVEYWLQSIFPYDAPTVNQAEDLFLLITDF